jgi:hypothetical protein
MARSLATLPSGTRVTDFVSLGVLADRLPLDKIQEVLQQTGRQSQRQRHLPAHVVVYYVVALALYMEVSYEDADSERIRPPIPTRRRPPFRREGGHPFRDEGGHRFRREGGHFLRVVGKVAGLLSE